MLQQFSVKGFSVLLILGFCSGPALANDLTIDPVISVKRHLELDTRLHASDIQVSQKKGEIILTGTVESLQEKQLAEEVTQRIVGYNYSIAGLKVKPPFVPDTKIQNEIDIAVPAHCQVEIHDLQITVHNGNVILKGRTNALHHKMVAEYVATNIRGVKSVTNNIIVSGPKESDTLIRENILSLLSPYFKENNLDSVGAVVKNGNVTLSGRVDNFDQIRYIKEVSQNVPGVVAVRSELKKKHVIKESGSKN
ncbi:MAG: BON domain-containing protein [Deltaproteobacteria bacterium]|nr:BON domain-containing protein [Deltaproteobacteria bacterium]